MRLAPALFAMVLAMCLVVGVALLIPETRGGHGFAHPEHPGMFQVPSGEIRHGDVLWLGWAFGILQIAFYVGLMALGARKGNDLRGLGQPLLWGALAYAVTWTILFLTYNDYLTDPAPELFLGLPIPTAIFLYVFYPLPLLFVVLFISGYKRWVLTDTDLLEYRALLASRGKTDGEA